MVDGASAGGVYCRVVAIVDHEYPYQIMISICVMLEVHYRLFTSDRVNPGKEVMVHVEWGGKSTLYTALLTGEAITMWCSCHHMRLS